MTPAERRDRWEAAAHATGREVDRNTLAAYMAVADVEQQEMANAAVLFNAALMRQNAELRADRSAVLRWAADWIENSKRLRDLTDDHMRDVEAAADELRRLAADTETVVAYRNPDRPGALLCREHGGPGWGLTPLTSEDLPDGGVCTWTIPYRGSERCGRDVLIPWTEETA